MSADEIILLTLGSIFICSIFIAIALIFYIGRTRIKEIDKAVFGYEYPNDSVFALMIRVPNYASGFLWGWSAKRTGLKGKIEHFDMGFRWPFIASFILIFFGMICAIVGVVYKNYVGL